MGNQKDSEMKMHYFFILCAISSCFKISEGLVSVIGNITVAYGQRYYIHPSELQFNFNSSSGFCKVEVVSNEPITQRVGIFEPQVFDCHFQEKLLRYTHFGSVLLNYDIVKLRAYEFTQTDTISETFQIIVNIVNSTKTIMEVKQELVIHDFFSYSKPIDEQIIDLHDIWMDVSVCKISFSQDSTKLPAHGQIVVEGKRPIKTIKKSCKDFLNLGLKYEHLRPPTPNIDFIAILIEASHPLVNAGEPVIEWIHIPVLIESAFPNIPPKASFSSSYLMDVDQFILSIITPFVLSGVDEETPSSDLLFNISKPLSASEGDIIHLSDHVNPITSFWQRDLENYEIAYRPPNISFPERQLFEIQFEIFDANFDRSEPVVMHIAIRPSDTTGPRISLNSGLILLEGQSRAILPHNFHVVDPDNLEDVKMFVTGGLNHGSLLVNKKPGIVFTPQDIFQGKVIYRHDDSDSTKDAIHFRITDRKSSIFTKFIINIIPKDDSPPSLITNIGLQVTEGGSAPLTAEIMKASDCDFSDEFITIKITQQPKFGFLIRKLPWEATGTVVSNFTQVDINRGVIFYHHNGEKVYNDDFSVRLYDIQVPPNESQLYSVMINILSVADDPPQLVNTSSLHLQIPEDKVLAITKDMLLYIDTESENNEIVFTVKTPPYFTKSYSKLGAGKLTLIDNVDLTSKNGSFKSFSKFSQEHINHMKLVYVPPLEDIGPFPKHVSFSYSVSDHHGNVIKGQLFNITILPVNNQPPVLFTRQIEVDEGKIITISKEDILFFDPDTLIQDLRMKILVPPQHGKLLWNQSPLGVDNVITMNDIEDWKLKYAHDDSETTKDQFQISVSDGVHDVSENVNIAIRLLDDEPPKFVDGLQQHFFINEGGIIAITSQALQGTDIDTDDENIHFWVIQEPLFGSIVQAGNVTYQFTQKEIIDNKIFYIHNGKEIGIHPQEEEISFGLTDVAHQHELMSIHNITITILPVNNYIPIFQLRAQIFVEESKKIVINKDLIALHDRDTQANEVKIIIVQQPYWGYLENISPNEGYETLNYGKPIIEFTAEDLNEDVLYYVQNIHRGVEPTTDNFLIEFTDGVYKSSEIVIPINIISQNDEEPVISFKNFEIHEGGMQLIDRDILKVTDADIPKDNIVLSLREPPKHGLLFQIYTDEFGYLFERPFKELPYDSFGEDIFYRHDDSETVLDQFEVLAADGKHVISQQINITIIPVNDEEPVVIYNRGLKNVTFGGFSLISSDILQAKDFDNNDSEIIFEIVTLPKFGDLEIKTALASGEPVWILFPSHKPFSQKDIANNIVRYHHRGEPESKAKDKFRFHVSDGQHISKKETFEIEILNTLKSEFYIHITNFEISSGSTVMLNSNIIQARDNSNQPDEIVFLITKQPSFGDVILISKPEHSISNFLYTDILGGQVQYRHRSQNSVIGRDMEDSFDFIVTNGLIEKNGTLKIKIRSLENHPPILEVLNPLITFTEVTIITSTNIHAVDKDSPSIFYQIVKAPKYGFLFKIQDNLKINYFTQKEINNELITYHRFQPTESDEDYFLFTVNDGIGNGYFINGTFLQEPVRMMIILNTNEDDEINVEINFPDYLEHFEDGGCGFRLSNEHIIINQQRSLDSKIHYFVTNQPFQGYLKNISNNQIIEKQFSQDDLNKQRIVYILKINDKTVHNDSFEFQIIISQKIHSSKYRMNFDWAVVNFNQSVYNICESDGIIHIPVTRIGALRRSSYVTIIHRSVSAKENEDYIGRNIQLQFGPGQKYARWPLEIVDDELEEDLQEFFIVKLINPINAVVFGTGEAKINIFDYRNRSKSFCDFNYQNNLRMTSKSQPNGSAQLTSVAIGSNGKLYKFQNVLAVNQTSNLQQGKKSVTTTEININIPKQCSNVTKGLFHFEDLTNLFYFCNGNQWIPWNIFTNFYDSFQNTNDTYSSDSKHTPTVQLYTKQTKTTSSEYSLAENIINNSSVFNQEDAQKDVELETLTKYVNATVRNPSSEVQCSEGWELFANSCYLVVEIRLKWTEAEKYCRNISSYLTSVTSQAHNTWLLRLTNQPFWIGYSFNQSSQRWTFVNKDTSNFTFWRKGFPKLFNKHCTLVTVPKGRWINRACDQELRTFICSEYII